MIHVKRLAVLFILAGWLFVALSCSRSPVVVHTTPSGPVSGVVEEGVEVFRGIPYAEPPVGDNRWRAPIPVKPWKEVLPCSRFRSSCIQPQVSELEGGGEVGKTSEDCLYLNIWAPHDRKKEKLPVMVWIHGGAFMTGSGSTPLYSGSHLARSGVVVVTINYRLGPFGFLVHPALAKESPHGTTGNYGLLDQIEALRWVKKHISSFGGDPGRITIFGESAGALSVSYLTLSPIARGLFHRAIMQSGAPTSQRYIMPTAYGSMDQALATGTKFAEELGCAAAADPAGAMRAKTADEIMKAADTSLDFIFRNQGFLFAPVIDGRVLPDDPLMLLKAGRVGNVPVITGSNRDEASLFIDDLSSTGYKKWLSASFGTRAREILDLFPFGEREGHDWPPQRFFTALWFTEPARYMARSVAGRGGKAYLYRFSHVPENGLLTEFGSFHGQEVEYVFGALGTILSTGYDRTLSRTMMDYWVNFAATGDPNSARLPRWPAYDEKEESYMEFGSRISPRSGPDRKICDFVERLR